jgi:hypothetical protein
MRIAFLILNHRPPEQLLRLLTTLRLGLPEAPFVVHHDKFCADLEISAFEPIGNVHVLSANKPITWGDFSIVDACWRTLTWMIDHLQFDWVVLLSGQDYPIKPLNAFKDYLATIKADALLRAVPISSLAKAVDRRDCRRRYLYQYQPPAISLLEQRISDHLLYGIRRSTGRVIDIINIVQPQFKVYRLPDRMPYRIGWRARSTPFTPDRPCWYGPMWFTLSYRAAEFVARCASNQPDYVEYYRRTIIPDESATVTLICNAPELHVEACDIHYTRWSRPRTGHPDIFTITDLAELKRVPQYFARKFDIARDASILDRLDEILDTA